MPTHTKISYQKQTRIKKLAQDGVSQHMIAKMTGVTRQTIGRYVDFDNARLAPLKSLQTNMSSALHELLGHSMQLQHNLLIGLNGEDIAAMSITEKGRLLKDNSIVMGVTYDKIRLQDGKSTSNASHEIQLTQVHKALSFGPVSSASPIEAVNNNKVNEGETTNTQ